MAVHEFLEMIFTVVFGVLACIAAAVACILAAQWYLDGPEEDLDVVGSQYVGADGKWDWSKGDSPHQHYGAPRLREKIPAYRNGDRKYDSRRGIVSQDDKPWEDFEGVEYNEEKTDFQFVDVDTIPQEQAVEIELELTESGNGDYWR